jgi:hypothetical protein
VSADKQSPSPLELAVFCINVDLVTAEVVGALEERGIPAILVKGPAIANWLYSANDPRLYRDTDLLLRKDDWQAASETMEKLGFVDDLGHMAHPRMESGEGFPWGRAKDQAGVDLHYTLFGIGASPEALWEAFSAATLEEDVGGRQVPMPSHSARLLHIGLHAVQHGGEPTGKPMRDLERALAQVPIETWSETLELAERLEAAGAFATGMRLLPRGREIAEEIGADHGPDSDAALRLSDVPMVEGFQELAEASGLRRRVAIILRELFPTPAFMRWWTPIANRGRLGLLFSYFWRPLYLALHAPRGLAAWWRSRRSAL